MVDNETRPQEHFLITAMKKRMEGVTDQMVLERANTLIEGLEDFGKLIPRRVASMENDFLNLVEDPTDECGGGFYDDFTPDQIREVYFILSGQALE